jgi:hypothetical protein
MILTDSPVQLDDHPLAGLSPEQRDNVRAQAFGRVLAAIAIRKVDRVGNRGSSQADVQLEVVWKQPTEGE